jgi:hypothetical protein
MKSAVVALYTADPQGKLRYSNLIGLLQFDIDRQAKTRFLRIYDLDTLALSLEVEVYYGFQRCYRALTESLYMFEYPKGSIAFQFRNGTDAELMKLKIFANCPSLEEYEQVKKRNLEAARKKEEESSFLGRIKNFFGGDKPEEQSESEIISFKKNTSISFNLADGTFNTENVPPEWQEVFSALNLSKEDLGNKDLMGVIVEETILNQAKRQAEQESNKDLQQKVQLAQHDIKKEHQEFEEEVRRNTTLNLPPPPPPPPPLLTPPNMRISGGNSRNNLMDEIRNNNLRLKHVEVNSKEGKDQVTLDISDMNKEERNDHIENLRKKLQMRKKALNRRDDDDD